MPTFDPTLLEVLKSLPSPHRRHIIAQHKYPKEIKTQSAKLEYLADKLGAKGLKQYGGLYVQGHGSTFSLFLDVENRQTLSTILRKAKAMNPSIETGLNPELEEGDKPKLHRVYGIGETIQVEYAEMGATRQVINTSWQSSVYTPVRLITAVLRTKPLTIEIHGAMAEGSKRELLSLIENNLQLKLSEPLTFCDLSDEAKRDALATALQSFKWGQRQLGRAANLGHAEIYTDGTVPLDQQRDYIEQLKHAADRETFLLAWIFRIQHPDGYAEEANYRIKVQTGELRVNPRISEIAIESLRQNVIKLF